MTLDRIEKSAFRPGEYVGHARGVWRITKRERGGWLARYTVNPSEGFLIGRTLAELNGKLAQWETSKAAFERACLARLAADRAGVQA